MFAVRSFVLHGNQPPFSPHSEGKSFDRVQEWNFFTLSTHVHVYLAKKKKDSLLLLWLLFPLLLFLVEKSFAEQSLRTVKWTLAALSFHSTEISRSTWEENEERLF